MLSKLDTELLHRAEEIIKSRYVQGSTNHTVGAALRTTKGDIYVGVNLDMDGMHSVCAEQCAFGTALTNGETDFDTIATVGLFDGKLTILSPCGSCRQFMSKYAPNIHVVISADGKPTSVAFDKLLPYAYKLHVKY